MAELNQPVWFLDDCPNRTKRFRSRYPWASCFATAIDIIEALKKEEEYIEALYLDHDLGGMTFANSDREDCGMEVVRYLVENQKNIGRIYVHTLNPSAGREMVAKLRDSGYKRVYRAPFINLSL